MSENHYWRSPRFESVAEGAAAYRKFVLEGKIKSPLALLIALHEGKTIDETPIFEVVDELAEMKGTFNLTTVIRLMYQFRDSISDELWSRCRELLLNFSYWPDEAGVYDRAMATENHYMLYASDGILAAQLYPDKVFAASGESGAERTEKFGPRLERWLDLRYKTGFSEFLSSVYYGIHITGLLNIIDFVESPRLRRKAEMVLDTLFLDAAVNHWYGGLAAASGRAYFGSKTSFWSHMTLPALAMVFGYGGFTERLRPACSLAISTYRLPFAIRAIAHAGMEEPHLTQQRLSWRIEDAKINGLDPNNLDHAINFLTLEAYAHPKTFRLFVQMLDEFRWWENGVYSMFARRKTLLTWLRRFRLLGVLAWLFRKDLTRNYRPTANVYTYRTPDYILSTVQDYRKGYGGDQQQIWQASLSPAAIVFTTHPAKEKVTGSDTPDYWTGSGSLPRAAQVENVTLVHYRISRLPGLYISNKLIFTHLWFPKYEFEEVRETHGWIFGRCGQGFIAVKSLRNGSWTTEGEYAEREFITRGRRNTWICETGSQDDYGTFHGFVDAISKAEIRYSPLRQKLVYQSPSQGGLSFGWRGPLHQDGRKVVLMRKERYHTPWFTVDYPLQGLSIRMEEAELTHDWKNGVRIGTDIEENDI